MSKTFEVLLVEDNLADADLTRQLFLGRGLSKRLHVVRDGEHALSFLRGEGRSPTALLPDLIILDLNLPNKDGREVLKEIKSDYKLRQIPIVVWSSSDALSDVVNSYDLHANCYIKKPFDLESFAKVLEQIETFWLSIAELPRYGKS